MLSENLKKIREDKGLSKSKLASLSGIHRQTIRFIEDGITTNTGLETINALAKGLNVSVNELLK